MSEAARRNLARTWAAMLEVEHPGTRCSVNFDASEPCESQGKAGVCGRQSSGRTSKKEEG